VTMYAVAIAANTAMTATAPKMRPILPGVTSVYAG
jgi:hypothetical protein